MSCTPCAQRRSMLREAKAQAQAGELRAAARTVALVGRHIIGGKVVSAPPKQDQTKSG